MFNSKKVTSKARTIIRFLDASELDNSAYNSVLEYLEDELSDNQLSYYEYCALCEIIELIFKKKKFTVIKQYLKDFIELGFITLFFTSPMWLTWLVRL